MEEVVIIMALYPETPKPQMPYQLTTNWKTIVSAFDSGKEQRRQKQLYEKYDIVLTYNALSLADMATLWNFYVARKGSFEAFYFYTLETGSWTNLFIGMGDGATHIFDLPGKSTSSQKIYNNGVLQTLTTDYSIVAGGGVEDSDRVNFVAAPTANDILTCDIAGYMRIRCRFEEDKLTREGFQGILYKSGIKLKGLTTV